MIKKDRSFGFIPLHKKEDGVYVFVIQHRSGYWGFPKGHPEEGETPIESAKRELKEETNLEVDSLFCEETLEENYSFRYKGSLIQKRNTFYLGWVKEANDVSLDREELLDGKWVNINEALQVLTYQEGKNLCREAAKLLFQTMGGVNDDCSNKVN